MSKIKLIVEHTNSKRDLNGNCYWYTKVTSTRTGADLTFTTPHYSNSEGLIDLNWNEMLSSITELPIRQFNRLYKQISLRNDCKSEEIRKMIKGII